MSLKECQRRERGKKKKKREGEGGKDMACLVKSTGGEKRNQGESIEKRQEGTKKRDRIKNPSGQDKKLTSLLKTKKRQETELPG